MAYQFQPIGPAKTEGIGGILTPKLQQAAKLQTGTPIRPREEPEKKEQLLGALAGFASPWLAKGILDLLPEKWIYKPDPATPPAPGDLPKQRLPEVEGYVRGMDSPLEEEERRRIEDIKRRFPSYKDPQLERTAFGNILQGIASVAPGFALDDDSAESFLSQVGSSSKALATTEARLRKAHIDRELAIAQAKAEVGDLKPTKTEFSVRNKDGQPVPYTREVLTSADGSRHYIKSEGQAGVDSYTDIDGREHIYNPGDFYLDRSKSVQEGELTDPKDDLWMQVNGSAIGTGRQRVIRDPDTRAETTITEILTPSEGWKSIDRLWKEDNQQWTPFVAGVFKERENIGDADKALTTIYKDRTERQRAVNQLMGIAAPLLTNAKEAVEADSPEEYATLGAGATILNTVTQNIKAVSNLFGEGATEGGFRGRIDRLSNGDVTVMALLASTDAYQEAIESGNKTAIDAARERFLNSLENVDSDAGGLLGNIDTNWGTKYREIATGRAERLAAQVRLAYAAAAAQGEKGRSLSDQDIVNFMASLGFGTGATEDPAIIGKNVSNFIATQLQNFDRDETNFRDLAYWSRVRMPTDVNDPNYASDFGAYQNAVENTNAYLGAFGLSRQALAKLDSFPRTPEGDLAAKNLANDYLAQISSKTAGSAYTFFKYDETDRRLKYMPMFEHFERDPNYPAYFDKDQGIFNYRNPKHSVDWVKPRAYFLNVPPGLAPRFGNPGYKSKGPRGGGVFPVGPDS